MRLKLARMRPKLQCGEEADLMPLNCMQLQFVANPRKAQSRTRFQHNLSYDSKRGVRFHGLI
jgi:hypothetical protein